MTKKLQNLTSIQFTSISVWAWLLREDLGKHTTLYLSLSLSLLAKQDVVYCLREILLDMCWTLLADVWYVWGCFGGRAFNFGGICQDVVLDMCRKCLEKRHLNERPIQTSNLLTSVKNRVFVGRIVAIYSSDLSSRKRQATIVGNNFANKSNRNGWTYRRRKKKFPTGFLAITRYHVVGEVPG